MSPNSREVIGAISTITSQQEYLNSTNHALNVSGSSTSGVVPSTAFYEGLNAENTLPAAATIGNLVGATGDKYGRAVVLPNAMRDIVSSQTTTITNSQAEITIVSATASTYCDLLAIFISNTSSTGAKVDVRDSTSGTIRFSFYIPPDDVRGVSLVTPWPQSSANNNWTAQSSASVTSLIVSALFVNNK